MELRRYAHLLRRRILVVALAVVVGLAAGYLVTDRSTTYRAQSTIYVGSRQFAAIAESTNASAAMDRLTQTFAAMVKSNPVATAAIQLAHAPRTADQVVSATTAAAIPNTNYIVVYVTDSDPGIAAALANGVAQGFVDQVQRLEPSTASNGGTPAVTSVFQRASQPAASAPQSTNSNLALGGLFGLAGAVALVALLNYLDVSVKSPEDVERATGVPVLGTIPVLPRPATGTRSGLAPAE